MDTFIITKKEPYDPIEAEKLASEMPEGYVPEGGVGEDKAEAKG